MVQLASWLGTLPPTAADGGMRSGHSMWPLVLVVVALIVALPMAYIFGRNRGRPGT
jgi:hypothetical protein